jgi:hypothetical protein
MFALEVIAKVSVVIKLIHLNYQLAVIWFNQRRLRPDIAGADLQYHRKK